MNTPYILVILDGWGYREDTAYNAIAQANPQTMQMLMQTYPWTTLNASGTAAGTLPGYTGSSEIGHMSIGTGTVVEQPLMALSIAMRTDALDATWSFLPEYLSQIKQRNARLHIMGLLSDGGVHSHEDHAHALIAYAAQHSITNPILHPFLDGRDTPPQSARTHLNRLDDILQQHGNGHIATITGRYYAMDRDQNWNRTLRAYRCLMTPHDDAAHASSWKDALSQYYNNETTDEFVPPTRISDAHIQDGDAVICFNFRADRMRQLTALLCDQTDIFTDTDHVLATMYQGERTPPHDYPKRRLSWMITGSRYHPDFNTTPLYTQPRPDETMCDVLAEHNKRIYRIAETQKYAHVTYFFNGGDERTYLTETGQLIPSLQVASYKDYPHMSAHEITNAVSESLAHDPHDCYIINYANPDMVAHTGDMQATQEAITCIDEQLKHLYTLAKKHKAELHITSDHGNAEDMYYPERDMPRTSHTAHPVPYIAINTGDDSVPDMYGLADIAPYILTRMGLSVPTHMRDSYTHVTNQSHNDR